MWIRIGVMLAALAWTGPALACTPVLVNMSIDDAQTYLRRATDARSLYDAKDNADRAARALGDAELYLLLCNCMLPAIEFSSAQRAARDASYSGTLRQFADEIELAVRRFRSALDYITLKVC